ncbi:MAG: AAA family ATPase [Pirellulales bacterium]
MIQKMKWKDPKRFDEFIGKDSLIKRIAEGLKNQSLPQFITLDGPTGSGKTTFGNILAHRLVCANAQPTDLEPCGECHACRDEMHEAFWTTNKNYLVYNCSHYLDVPDEFLRIIRNSEAPYIMFFDELQDLSPASQKHFRAFLDSTDRRVIITTTHFRDLNDALKNRLWVHKIQMTYPTFMEIFNYLQKRFEVLGIKTKSDAQIDRIITGFAETMRPLLQFPEKVAAECPDRIVTDEFLDELFGPPNGS